jgi:endonuclease/exonuclease/phosphatase (EEP) superfamily protein YafD
VTSTLRRNPHRRPRGQAWLVVLGVLVAIPAAFATWLRVLPPSSDELAKVASFIPYGLVMWVPAMVLLGTATIRSWRHHRPGRVVLGVLSLLAAAGLTAAAAWEAPAFIPDRRPVVTPPLTVISLNVAGTADPTAVTQAAAGADVVVFVEASEGWRLSLPERFYQWFPHQAPPMHTMDVGSVIFSRYPLRAGDLPPSNSFQLSAAIVDTPQLGPVRVAAVHPCNPYCGDGLWMREAAHLRSWLAGRDLTIPTVVAGDFNSVDDHSTMRDLYADGFRSAANLAGAGFVRTWPANRRIPPLIGIDHILVDGRLTATEFAAFEVPGTDHLGVQAVIAGT